MSDTPAAKHYPPSDKATIPGRLSTKVAGPTFVPNYPGVYLTLADVLAQGHTPLLILVRDADNPYDSNAVAVRSAKKGTPLGHLPAALAARIAPELDAGTFWLVESYEVLVMPGHEDRPGLSLNLRRMSERSGSLSPTSRTL